MVLAIAGYPLAAAAMTAAAALILEAGIASPKALARVDWPLLLFFAGLFVVVRGVENSGALEAAFRAVTPWLAGEGAPAAFAGLTVDRLELAGW